MILEELKTIKSFGAQVESSVTLEEIAAKEKKLKIKLPDALKELYLTFHPEDPLFSGPRSLIPFEELKLQRIRRTYWHFVLLPFSQDEGEGAVYSVGIEMKASPKNEYSQNAYYYQEEADPPVFKGTDILHEDSRPTPVSEYIIEWIATHQVYTMPSILGLEASCRSSTWFLPEPHLAELPCLYPAVSEVRLSEELSPVFLVTDSDWRRPDGFVPRFYWDRAASKEPRQICTLIGARSDEPLEKLLERTGLEPRWQRSQNGHDIYQLPKPAPKPEPFRPKEERELISIAPVLEFLRGLAGAEGPCATDESIAKAEERLGGELPLPLKEYYRYMPKAYYRCQNSLTPPGSLRPRKDGKITFLTENQWSCYWGVSRESSFLFRRENEDKSPWEPVGVADGFLAAEFLLELGCSEKLEMDTFPDFKPEMLQEGGALRPCLSDIAGITEQIAVGNSMRLYQGMDGKLAAMCFFEGPAPELHLYARDQQTIDAFLALANG